MGVKWLTVFSVKTPEERAQFVVDHWLKTWRACPVGVRDFILDIANKAKQHRRLTARQIGAFMRYCLLNCEVCGKEAHYRHGQVGWCLAHKGHANKARRQTVATLDKMDSENKKRRIYRANIGDDVSWYRGRSQRKP